METSTGVLRRFPTITGAVAGIHKSSSLSCAKPAVLRLCCNDKQGLGANLESRKMMVSGTYDKGCLEYYGKIRCGKKEKNKEKDMALKKTKKKLKLLKGLSKDLNNLSGFSFGTDVGLVDQVQAKTISEAAELLLGQLQRLKAEEKELKRKRKEEKKGMKMKGASEVQGTMMCEMSSSSSSSSESSDDECRNLVDMKNLKCETLAKTIPEACDRALENATSTIENLMIEPQTLNPEAGDCCISSSSSNVAVGATATGTKKIEVCMGGKCKRSGAAALLEKFQEVVGIEAAVSGCKCMGKCKVGPNVKVSSSCAGDSVFPSPTPATSNSLCIGVGLEDVNLIAANLLGRNQEVGLANAVC